MAGVLTMLLVLALLAGLPAWLLYQSYNAGVAAAFVSITWVLLSIYWELKDLRARVEGEIRVAERKRENELTR